MKYIKQCERCGVRFCKPCIKCRKKQASAERRGLSSSFWDKKPSHESMYRLAEIAKYGLHYHEAKEEFKRKEG